MVKIDPVRWGCIENNCEISLDCRLQRVLLNYSRKVRDYVNQPAGTEKGIRYIHFQSGPYCGNILLL